MYHSTNSTNVMVNFMNSLFFKQYEKEELHKLSDSKYGFKEVSGGFTPQIRDWFIIQKPINVTYHIASLK